MKQLFAGLLESYVEHCHGRGAVNQYWFYRCEICSKLVTWNYIRTGGCKCGGIKVRPTNPRKGEWFRIFLLPWTV